MRLAAIVLALGLPGCDQVLGLTQVHPLADGRSDGTPAFQVTGRYHELYATNDSNGLPAVIDRLYDPTEISLTAVLDDGSSPLVAYQADGTFAFGLAASGQAYRLRVTNDFGVIEYQLAAPALDLAVRTAGRPDRTPVTAPTYLDFKYGATPGTAIVATTGLWTYTAAGATGNVDFNYQTASSLGGPVGLLDATTEHDRLVFTLWENYPTASPTYAAIGSYAIGDVTMTNGGTYAITGALVPNTQTQCAHLLAENGANYQRLAVSTGATYSSQAADWYVYTVPSIQQTTRVGALPLAGQGYSSAIDVNVMPAFGNPYSGNQLLASAGASGVRTMSPPGQTPFAIADGFRVWSVLDTSQANCQLNLATLAGTIGLVAAPVLGGSALTADGQTVSIDPHQPLALSWATRETGPVDYYTVTIAEVQNSAFSIIETVVTTLPSALLDPALFADGHVYALQLGTHTGLPNTAAGDTTTATFPLQDANMWSTAFVAAIEAQ